MQTLGATARVLLLRQQELCHAFSPSSTALLPILWSSNTEFTENSTQLIKEQRLPQQLAARASVQCAVPTGEGHTGTLRFNPSPYSMLTVTKHLVPSSAPTLQNPCVSEPCISP